MERKLLDKLAELSFISRSRLNALAQREQMTLPPFQLRVLSVIGRFPEQRQQSLLQKRGWDKGQVARAFKELERLQLICRCGDSTPQRIAQVTLTAEGLAMFERLEQVRAEQASTALTGFTAQEIQQLDSLMDRMLDNIASAPPLE